MTIKELLPIGSVIILKDGQKPLMIYGVKQNDGAKKDSAEYDYIGVLYPEGNIGTKFQFLFNHEDITNVLFRGFEDEARNEFIEKLSKVYESK